MVQSLIYDHLDISDMSIVWVCPNCDERGLVSGGVDHAACAVNQFEEHFQNIHGDGRKGQPKVGFYECVEGHPLTWVRRRDGNKNRDYRTCKICRSAEEAAKRQEKLAAKRSVNGTCRICGKTATEPGAGVCYQHRRRRDELSTNQNTGETE